MIERVRWKLAHGRSLDLSRVRLMGILNATPDSFADGGRLASVADARDAARAMIAAGAEILDVGGESTRPGARRVDAREQIRRVVPVIEAIRTDENVREIPLSVDTTLEDVAAAALKAGADAINDVSAGLESPGMLALAARTGAGLVLMHRLAPPQEDRYSDRYEKTPAYADVTAEVRGFLRLRVEAALAAGVERGSIVLDPGLGFGKSVEQNLELIRRTGELAQLGFPVLSALSRKSFVGRVSLGRDSDPSERLPGTLALSLAHAAFGASILRVHDIAEHAAALRTTAAAGGLSLPPVGPYHCTTPAP